MKNAVLIAVMFTASFLCGQGPAGWPCADDVFKSEGDNRRVRVGTVVVAGFVEKKVLPDVSDLKDKKTNSTVVFKTLIGKDGTVRCADAVKGDTNLVPRSREALKQWRFRPYLLNGQPIMVDTEILFIFKEDTVTAPR
jgi:hypothetical protein